MKANEEPKAPVFELNPENQVTAPEEQPVTPVKEEVLEETKVITPPIEEEKVQEESKTFDQIMESPTSDVRDSFK